MPKAKGKRFWNFNTEGMEDSTAELILYGDISQTSWYEDDVTPTEFSRELQDLGAVKEIVVRINSNGGDVFAAAAIYTRLKDHKAKITVKIDGWAASAATIIAMAGDEIIIPENGIMMIHDPMLGLLGYYNETELAEMIKELKVVKASVVNAYEIKTKLTKEEIAQAMQETTWLLGQEAVDKGFADKTMFGEVTEIKNSNKSIVVNGLEFSPERYGKIPNKVLNHCHPSDGDININKNDKSKGEKKKMEIKTVEELRNAYPELVANVVKEAGETERSRIKDIENIAPSGFDEIINKAKFEEPKAAGEVAVLILNEQKQKGKDYLDKRNKDAKNSGAGDVGVSIEDIDSEEEEEKKNKFVNAIDKAFPKTK